MKRIRAFQEDDIPRVASLSRKVFVQTDHRSLSDYEKAYENVFFRSPWYDPAISSLVYLDNNRRVVGFLGVIPRPMEFKEAPVQAAVSQHMIVDPEAHTPMAGLELLSAFLEGPQDCSMADMATPISKKLWERAGGSTALVHSIHWRRPLRLGSFGVNRVKKEISTNLAAILYPFARIADKIGARWSKSPFVVHEQPWREKDLDTKLLLDSVHRFSKRLAYRPVYELSSLQWIVDAISRQTQFGTLQMKGVFDEMGSLKGWYIYYLHLHGISEVLQVGADSQTIDGVMKTLFYNAWKLGATELAGRLDPRFTNVFAENSCLFVPGRTWMLLSSKDIELELAIHLGDAFLTRLEGDLWLV